MLIGAPASQTTITVHDIPANVIVSDTSAKSPRRLLGYRRVPSGTSAHNGFLKLLRVSESIDRVKGTLSYFGSSTPSHDYYHPVTLVVTESFENLIS